MNGREGIFAGKAESKDGCIWLRGEGEAGTQITADPSNTFIPMFRRRVSIGQGKIRRARLYITSRGIYDCRINGKRVTNRLLAPGLTQYDVRMNYQTYDVTKLLKPGENALGVTLSSGWWSDAQTYTVKNYHYFGDKEALLCKRVIVMEDGSRQEPVLEGAYDVPVYVVERRRAKSRREVEPGTWIYDLEQEMAGVPRITFHEKAGTKIIVRYAEMLYPDMPRYGENSGKIMVENYRDAASTDIYFCCFWNHKKSRTGNRASCKESEGVRLQGRDRLHITEYFDFIVDGTLVKRAKPDPEVFTAAADHLGIVYKDCVVFEDSAAGIQAAKAAGMTAVGIGTRENLPMADYLYSCIEEVYHRYGMER